MRLIVTRPEPDATRTAEALIRLGHEAILSPMLDIVTLPRVRLSAGDFQAVLVTSANAVRTLVGQKESVPKDTLLLAVGDQTALEARRAGFQKVRSAGGVIEDLIALAKAELSPSGGPLFYAAGEAQAGDLPGRLTAAGFSVETVVLYRAVPRENLARAAEDVLRKGEADGVLLYSRRSALAFVDAAAAADLLPLSKNVALFCISASVSAALPERAGGRIAVAARPDQMGLFALVEQEATQRAAGATAANDA
jgi:uroporphyrinogen-III synthase